MTTIEKQQIDIMKGHQKLVKCLRKQLYRAWAAEKRAKRLRDLWWPITWWPKTGALLRWAEAKNYADDAYLKYDRARTKMMDYEKQIMTTNGTTTEQTND